MSFLERPSQTVKQTVALYTAADMLAKVPDFSDYAEELGLIDRVLRGDHKTGKENALRHLVPYANICALQGVPSEFGKRRALMLHDMRAALRNHTAMLDSDRARISNRLHEDKGIVLVLNSSHHPYAVATHADIEKSAQSEDTRLSYEADRLAVYSGEVILQGVSGRQFIVCDIDRLPSDEMREYIRDEAVTTPPARG